MKRRIWRPNGEISRRGGRVTIPANASVFNNEIPYKSHTATSLTPAIVRLMCGLRVENHELKLLRQVDRALLQPRPANRLLLHAPRQLHELPEQARPLLVVVHNYGGLVSTLFFVPLALA